LGYQGILECATELKEVGIDVIASDDDFISIVLLHGHNIETKDKDKSFDNHNRTPRFICGSIETPEQSV
jgi:hypothetical protein